MMSDEMVELLEGGKVFATDTFASQGRLNATVMVETPVEMFVMALAHGDSPEAKQVFRDEVQKLVESSHATGVCFVSEIWYSSDPSTQPRHAKDRKEALLVCAENAMGEVGAFLADIHRTGKTSKVGEWQLFPPPAAGIFTGFFKSVRPALLH